jgi:hypothetical protein
LALIGSRAIKLLLERYRRQKLEGNAAAVTTSSSVAYPTQTLTVQNDLSQALNLPPADMDAGAHGSAI